MNVGEEFEYAEYRRVHQPQYDNENHVNDQNDENNVNNVNNGDNVENGDNVDNENNDNKENVENNAAVVQPVRLYSIIEYANLGASERKMAVIEEVVRSEHKYLSHIGLINEAFRKNLTRIRSASSSQIKTLLCDIATVYRTNKALFDCFCSMPMAKAFLLILPYLKLYSTYASQFPNSLVVYAELIKKDDFCRSLERLEEQLNGQTLRSLLIMPVQRIPRYILLIEKLMLVCTDPNEMHHLHKVISEMRNISDDMQRFQDTYTNAKKLLEIQDQCSLKKHVFEPGRIFLKQGNLQKMNLVNSKKSFEDRMFFLFNDALMCAERKYFIVTRTNYDPSFMISLRHATAEYDENDGSILLKCGDIRMLLTADKFRTIKEWYKSISDAIAAAKTNRMTLRKDSFNKVMFFDKNFIGRKTVVIRSHFKRRDSDSLRASLAETHRKRYHEDQQPKYATGEKRVTLNDSVCVRKFDHISLIKQPIPTEVEPKLYNGDPLTCPMDYDEEDKKPRNKSKAREYLVIREHKWLSRPKSYLLPEDEQELLEVIIKRDLRRQLKEQAERARNPQPVQEDVVVEPEVPIEPEAPVVQEIPVQAEIPVEQEKPAEHGEVDEPEIVAEPEEELPARPVRTWVRCEQVLPVQRDIRLPGEPWRKPSWWGVHDRPPACPSPQPTTRRFFKSAKAALPCSIM